MNSITHKGRTTILVLVSLVIICVLFLGNKVSGEVKKLNLRNATDSLMLLIELATESGDDYAQAKSDPNRVLELRLAVQQLDSSDRLLILRKYGDEIMSLLGYQV